MDIIFRTKKLEKQLTIHKNLVRKHGLKRARKVELRLTQMRAANTLADLALLPQMRCHELEGELEGLLSVDLEHPYRLLFSPAHNPIPKKPDGGLDWSQVTSILIEEIEDTHG
jgi:plasmid maintenance system killer protein